MNEELYIDGDVYETVSDESRVATAYLIRLKDRLGIPDSAVLEGSKDTASRSNKIILAYAKEIYKVWAALYPQEHRDFIAATEFELKYERPVKEAIKAGGYSPISYPTRLDSMFHLLLPEVKTQDRRFWEPLLKNIPELKRTNYFK